MSFTLRSTTNGRTRGALCVGGTGTLQPGDLRICCMAADS